LQAFAILCNKELIKIHPLPLIMIGQFACSALLWTLGTSDLSC